MVFPENHNGHFELQHALSKVRRHVGLHKSLLYIENNIFQQKKKVFFFVENSKK